MSNGQQERTLRKEFDEIRARYTELLREVLATSDVLPDWLINLKAACACGDKCSTGSTDIDRFSDVVLPESAVGARK